MTFQTAKVSGRLSQENACGANCSRCVPLNVPKACRQTPLRIEFIQKVTRYRRIGQNEIKSLAVSLPNDRGHPSKGYEACQQLVSYPARRRSTFTKDFGPTRYFHQKSPLQKVSKTQKIDANSAASPAMPATPNNATTHGAGLLGWYMNPSHELNLFRAAQ